MIVSHTRPLTGPYTSRSHGHAQKHPCTENRLTILGDTTCTRHTGAYLHVIAIIDGYVQMRYECAALCPVFRSVCVPMEAGSFATSNRPAAADNTLSNTPNTQGSQTVPQTKRNAYSSDLCHTQSVHMCTRNRTRHLYRVCAHSCPRANTKINSIKETNPGRNTKDVGHADSTRKQ